MAIWKRILICLGILLLAFAVMFLILFITIYKTPMPSVTLGRYNLVKISEFAGDEELEIESFENGEYYILIKEDYILESHSEGHGIEPTEKMYYYFLSGEEMPIYNMGDETLAYTAIYKNNIIRMFETHDNTLRYYYYKYVTT